MTHGDITPTGDANAHGQQYSSRRDARIADARDRRRGVAGSAFGPGAKTVEQRVEAPTVTRKPSRLAAGRNALVMTFAAALVATVALPAYAINTPEVVNSAGASPEAQNVVVAADAAGTTASRDNFSATTQAELDAAAAAVERERVAAERAAAVSAQQAQVASYTGSTAAQYAAAPSYANFDASQLISVAQSYTGVPYVFGGATPAGFDCSGFTQYVFAQFGISLPHSSRAQGNGGVRVSAADAMPGDLVILENGGHVGIYVGGGMMVDSGRPGTGVSTRPIYSSNHWFVRYGS